MPLAIEAGKRAQRTGESYEVEFRLRDRHGHYRWFLSRGLPMRDAQGRIVKWFGTCTDMDDQKRQEAERIGHLAEIEALNTRLQRAMMETHHRVKNNLQVIAALVDMQTMDAPDMIPAAEFQRLSTHIRTLAVVHDILTQETRAEGEAKSVSAKLILEKLLPLLEQASGAQRPIRAQITEARLSPRQGTALALVTNELISNALKHGRGEIEVTLTVQEECSVLAVCDDGPGFPEGFQPGLTASMGLELVETLSRTDLGGQTAYTNRAQGGARVLVTIPLSGGYDSE